MTTAKNISFPRTIIQNNRSVPHCNNVQFHPGIHRFLHAGYGHPWVSHTVIISDPCWLHNCSLKSWHVITCYMRLWKPCCYSYRHHATWQTCSVVAGFSETCSPLGIHKIPNQLYCHTHLTLVIALEIKHPASHSLTGFGMVGRTKINRSCWRSHKSVRIYICTFCSQYINFYARTAYFIDQVHSNPCLWWDRNIIVGTAWGYNQALVLVIRLWSWWAPWSLCFSSNNILCLTQYTIHACLSGIRTQEVHFWYLAMDFLKRRRLCCWKWNQNITNYRLCMFW